MIKTRKLTYIFLFIMAFFVFVQNAKAEGISIIRDEEIERFIKEIAKPIFKVAGLNYENIHIYIINDNSINAFVSGGQNVFVHTGLIRRYDTPDALVGVIAHEVGHIAAGHLVAGYENYSSNSALFGGSVILATIAALSGSPDAGQAIVMGGIQVAQQNVLKFSRTQEEEADQLAINFLRAIGLSPVALEKVLEDFYDQDVQLHTKVDEYSQTHPLSIQRLSHVRANLKTGENNLIFNSQYQKRLDLVKMKLEAFLDNAPDVLQKYSMCEDEVAKYGKSIAYYRIFQKDRALDEVNGLIEMEPANPYFYELKGQILFELRDPVASIEPYGRADELLNNSALIKISLANSILSDSSCHSEFNSESKKNSNGQNEILNQVQDDKNARDKRVGSCKDLNAVAIAKLEEAVAIEDDNALGWKLLAKAYNNEGNLGLSYLNLAEYYLRMSDAKNAKRYAQMSQEHLTETAYLLRSNDVIMQAERIKKK